MEELTIKLQYTKEDLRKYQFFTYFKKSRARLLIFILAAIIGVFALVVSFATEYSSTLVFLGSFLILFPGIIALSLIVQSDMQFKSMKMYGYENVITFYEDHIYNTTTDSTQKIYWDKVYEVIWTKKELVIYLGRNIGIYLVRSKYDPEMLYKIEELMKKSMPLNKFKLR